ACSRGLGRSSAPPRPPADPHPRRRSAREHHRDIRQACPRGALLTDTFYITSLVLAAALVGPIVRSHWAIENSLHWVMDMVFRDDECRVRTENAPANFTTLKHMAHNLIRKAPGKDSLRLRRKVAAWDDDFLASLIAK
ncbi:MAG: ISAs1 family transposase, partial [Caulobacter sp.]|nr:ISAs1 family transposase [Caulobacter sp.]